jgi:hypothetical protein
LRPRLQPAAALLPVLLALSAARLLMAVLLLLLVVPVPVPVLRAAGHHALLLHECRHLHDVGLHGVGAPNICACGGRGGGG